MLKTNKEYKKLKKQEVLHIFIEFIKHVFSMIWLMELINTYREDLLLMKYGDYKRGLASVVHNFLIKNMLQLELE